LFFTLAVRENSEVFTAYLTSLDMSDVAGEMEKMKNKELN
jgi:hypothetical protein